jgi:hypothetical protein
MDLESGKMYSVDLNNDKVNDINIKYLGINSTNGRGIFFIQALNKPLPVAEMPKETVTAETDTSTTAELGNVAETQSELETVAPVTEAPESKSKIMLLAGIVLLVLAVLFGLFIWWYAKKNAHHHR